jgi:hypothetical protein
MRAVGDRFRTFWRKNFKQQPASVEALALIDRVMAAVVVCSLLNPSYHKNASEWLAYNV